MQHQQLQVTPLLLYDEDDNTDVQHSELDLGYLHMVVLEWIFVICDEVEKSFEFDLLYMLKLSSLLKWIFVICNEVEHSFEFNLLYTLKLSSLLKWIFVNCHEVKHSFEFDLLYTLKLSSLLKWIFVIFMRSNIGYVILILKWYSPRCVCVQIVQSAEVHLFFILRLYLTKIIVIVLLCYLF